MGNEQPRAIQRLRATNIQQSRLTNEQVFEQFSELVWRCTERHTSCDKCPKQHHCCRLFEKLGDKSAEGKLLVNGRYHAESAQIAEELLNILAEAMGESLDEDRLLVEAMEDGDPELQTSG